MGMLASSLSVPVPVCIFGGSTILVVRKLVLRPIVSTCGSLCPRWVYLVNSGIPIRGSTMIGDYKRCSLPEAGFFVTVHNPSRMMFLFLLLFLF